MSNFGNSSNSHLGLSPLLKHLTPKVLFLVLAVPVAALIIWFATRTSTIKRAASLGRSVSHPASLLTSGTKPKPPAGKLEQPASAPAPLPPAPDWSKLQATNSAPTIPTQGSAQVPATNAVVPAPIPGVAPSPATVSSARPVLSAALSYNAHHDKVFGGGCSGQLVLSSTGLQFNCPEDSHSNMQIALSEISAVDENGVRLTSGKKLHFTIAGMTKPSEQALFTDWLNRLR